MKLTLNISDLSSQYTVRKMTAKDVDCIYELYMENPMYFRYCPPLATKESVLKDMSALPLHKTEEDKYYISFFKGTKLVAVMDLIFHYPDKQTVFIGLFMVSGTEQGKGVGSEIINECCDYFLSQQYCFIRLGYAKGNPQSEAFWKKNGFEKVGLEIDNENYTVVVMQKQLQG